MLVEGELRAQGGQRVGDREVPVGALLAAGGAGKGGRGQAIPHGSADERTRYGAEIAGGSDVLLGWERETEIDDAAVGAGVAHIDPVGGLVGGSVRVEVVNLEKVQAVFACVEAVAVELLEHFVAEPGARCKLRVDGGVRQVELVRAVQAAKEAGG